ncbi:FliM/FliN family flagellar motor switch protein [Erwinia pyrifoliae]|uniref:FliM/FliN family flagellar motor switch protein n=1 Tax=Erwinia pyrifoliae TaxID=79967 RepID=A0ABY5XD30_ERWPY|nr:FliM/FliN family flagellar motor switch protein [Erwinia pyrifoliae]UWS35325.1 FliM/FliN family flagellar motor switch protein [Erwinia pyrifoliae]
MSLRHHLRHVDQSQRALEFLKNSHIGSEVIVPKAEGRYLRLILKNDSDLRNEALINVDDWLQMMDYRLPGIPWQQVPLSYLIRWLNSLNHIFILKAEEWGVEEIKLPCASLPEKILCIPAKPCPLLCIDWSEGINPEFNKWHLRQYGINFILDLHLGYSQLPISLISDIALGDLLLIQHQLPSLQIGKNKLFHLSLINNQEVVVLEKFTDQQEEYRDEEETLHKWSDLPIEIEFVLDSKSTTLAELDTIEPGTAFPLNQCAEQRVKIYLNRKFFARGELVALDNGNLAVEIRQINTVLVDDMDIYNAE